MLVPADPGRPACRQQTDRQSVQPQEAGDSGPFWLVKREEGLCEEKGDVPLKFCRGRRAETAKEYDRSVTRDL
ncbi:hypothetical protein Q5P01_021021 [Channa striata]|uniref:Uncharacterized protein n=1 Tax=Channa striata TaxID=64152 RepID=A0AA88S2D3_CHASR|nr:hypothetical protein Q5P01_021021 [Channa striata]